MPNPTLTAVKAIKALLSHIGKSFRMGSSYLPETLVLVRIGD
jgi:hypothetical protein